MSGWGTAAAITATLASTAMNVYSQQQQAQQQAAATEASAKYNAQVAENEASTQRAIAQNEISKGIADRERQQRQAAREMGEMRANMGASGFEMDSGSSLNLLAESAQEHQYDSQVITSNANQSAWQHLAAATSAENQASFYNWQGSNAYGSLSGTGMSSAGTIVGGIGKSVGQYNTWKTK